MAMLDEFFEQSGVFVRRAEQAFKSADLGETIREFFF